MPMPTADQSRADAEITPAKIVQLRVDQKVSAFVEKSLMTQAGYQFPLHINTSLEMFKKAMNAGRRTRQS